MNPTATDLGEREFAELRDLVYERTGIALGPEKRSLLHGRLLKRLRALGVQDFGAYLERLRESAPGDDEWGQFQNVVTTNKTEFLRENHHFRFLAETWLPPRIESARRGGPRRIRIWSSASSTGEEPYSIAFTLRDALASEAPAWDVKITASDINTRVLRVASEGVYPVERVLELPENVRKRHFLRGTGEQAHLARVKKHLREWISFRQINLMEARWNLEGPFDAIFCRNVMIYFDRPTQERLVRRFMENLVPEGHLFLGHSECIHGWFPDLQPIGGTVYRKK